MKTATKIIKVAKAEVGYREGQKNGSNNNDQKFSNEVPGYDWSDFQAWCATFVVWSFWKTGNLDLLPTPSASCDVLASGFKANGRWSEYPAVGAVVFYGTPADLNHTGIVVSYDKNNITTVEGNTNDDGSREGDGVYLKVRARKGVNVIGYGLPKYAEGIDSADPKFAAKPGVKPEPKPVNDDKPNLPARPSVSLAKVKRASRIANWAKSISNVTVRQDVRLVKDALKAEKVKNYAEWQTRSKVKANGVPDAKSLVILGRKHGFKVER